MERSWHGLPKVMMSTGSIFPPSILDTSPRCFMFGNRFVVTRMGKSSISLAHTGSIPYNAPASGKPPEPSNKLPNFIFITPQSLPEAPAAFP